MILGTSSIREVTAFPKNRSAYCPLTQAPSQVATEQLDELGLLEGTQKETIPGVQEQKELIDVLSWVSRIGLEAGERPAIVAALAGAMRLAELSEDRAGDEAPLFAPHPAANRMRANAPARVSPLAVTGEVLKNAPSVKGNYFKVASILE
jgi:aspartyl-tRNA synthetase